jgi:hypothetical protein
MQLDTLHATVKRYREDAQLIESFPANHTSVPGLVSMSRINMAALLEITQNHDPKEAALVEPLKAIAKKYGAMEHKDANAVRQALEEWQSQTGLVKTVKKK